MQGAEQGILSTYSIPSKGTCVQKPKKGEVFCFQRSKGLLEEQLTAPVSSPFLGSSQVPAIRSVLSPSAATWG